MVKLADYRKVIHFQNVLRIAQLIRAIKAKHPEITEEEIKSIFVNDYTPEIIEEGINRARCYVSFKKKR